MKNQSRYKSISYPSYSLLHNTYNRTQSNVLSANTSTLKQNKPQNTAGLLSPSKARIGFQTAHTHTSTNIKENDMEDMGMAIQDHDQGTPNS